MPANDSDLRFASAVEEILESTWEFYPNLASGLGLHDYDGRLTDISAAALARRARELNRGLNLLQLVDASALNRQNHFDHRILSSALQRELFELMELRTLEINPMETLWHIEFSNYVKRDYAPLEQRVDGLTKALEEVPAFLATVRDTLGPRLAKPVLEASIEAYEGLASFYDKELREAAEGVGDADLRRRFDEARRTASRAVGDFVDHLKRLRDTAIDDFALGADKFLKLLRLGDMVELPLERLLEVGTEDLARNRARFRQVSAQIDPKRPPKEVMSDVARDHPTADSLIDETRDMLENIRQFLIDKGIVTVPSEVRCQTTETPSFMRWAFAAMDMPGPFETKATEAYYYVTPVEDHWTDRQKEEWLTSFNRASLQNISVHEAYPGHYVHLLHTRDVPSKISQVFGAYSFLEGWAHYTEEMMVEVGYAGSDPKLLLGQLSDALLRDCRYLCSIRMHTEGMTVDEATRFFMDNAYMEELPAGKEAMRGTFDPMYLNYTLGKLMILKLREDYRAERGEAFSLREFHDTFLSFAAHPPYLWSGR